MLEAVTGGQKNIEQERKIINSDPSASKLSSKLFITKNFYKLENGYHS